MLSKGLVQIYTGEGKGKTTAALGLALRAAGARQSGAFFSVLKAGSHRDRRAKDPDGRKAVDTSDDPRPALGYGQIVRR